MRNQHGGAILIAALITIPAVKGFSPRLAIISPKYGKAVVFTNYRSNHVPSLLKQSRNDDNYFDISKPSFDLYSLRQIRGDALLQYDTLNQSEPLRINLCLLFSFLCVSFPTIRESAIGQTTTPAVVWILSLVGGVGSFTLFLNECGKRNKQLNRIEKELNAESLEIRLPNSRFADRPYSSTPSTLKNIRPRRVVALNGSTKDIQNALIPFRVLRRRLEQANVLVVIVPTDDGSVRDWGFEESAFCLGEVVDRENWLGYFNSLVPEIKSNIEGPSTNGTRLVWFGLTSNGRSFASGVCGPPSLIEMLGQNLCPMESPDESDGALRGFDDGSTNAAIEKEILNVQTQFYDALTGGDLSTMKTMFADHDANEVTEVLSAGGRIDEWKKCLMEGSRPSGMKISGADVLVQSDVVAYSTAVEFPVNTGFDSATLLAVQRWHRDLDSLKWQLELHQTIPWNSDFKAGGTLKCDCRGCVALTRGRERRKFSGLNG